MTNANTANWHVLLQSQLVCRPIYVSDVCRTLTSNASERHPCYLRSAAVWWSVSRRIGLICLFQLKPIMHKRLADCIFRVSPSSTIKDGVTVAHCV